MSFKKGQNVRITDTGWQFTSYQDWAKDNGLTLYQNNKQATEGSVGRIVAAAPHRFSGYGTLYGVEVDGVEYIMEAKGLVLVALTTLPDVFHFSACTGTVYRMTRKEGVNFACTDENEVYTDGVSHGEWKQKHIIENLNDGTWTDFKEVQPPKEPEFVLPRAFAFVLDSGGCPFTVDIGGKAEDGCVLVKWSESDGHGYTGEVEYTVSRIRALAKSGSWKITKDLSAEVGRKEAFEAAKQALDDAATKYSATLAAYMEAAKVL